MPPLKSRTILLTSLILIILTPLIKSKDQSNIGILITEKGLNFIKNLLISKAISSLIPTPIGEIERTIKVPVVGKVHVVFKDVVVEKVVVGSSDVGVKDGGGVRVVGGGVVCDVKVKWHYCYGSWVGPVSVSDSGSANIEVKGMEVDVTLDMVNHEGSMKLSIVACNCRILDISIDLDGGASWFYQGFVDAFKDKLVSAVEEAITKKLKAVVAKLGYRLQTLPKQIPVDDIASLNVTFVNNPFMSDNSLGFDINGLFIENTTHTRAYHNRLQLPVSCSDPSKMIGIALDEAVFQSAFALYYNAQFMHWIVDQIPQQSLLNTAGWRFIIPQLYKKYPNADMNLDISLSDPPVMTISWQEIDAIVYADLIINVLEGDDTIPVACIALVIAGTGSVKITGNNLAGHLNIDDFTMSLKWSKIGTLHMFLIQPVMWTLIETVFLPYANTRLGIGFPLPIMSGFKLQNAEITLSSSRITVCSDASYEESFNSSRFLIYTS